MKALKQLRAPKAVAPVSEEVVMKDLVEAINDHLALRNTPSFKKDTGITCLKVLA